MELVGPVLQAVAGQVEAVAGLMGAIWQPDVTEMISAEQENLTFAVSVPGDGKEEFKY